MNRFLSAAVRAFGSGRRLPVLGARPSVLENAEPCAAYPPFELGHADAAELHFCEPEQRTTAHAVDVHGERRCLDCHHTQQVEP